MNERSHDCPCEASDWSLSHWPQVQEHLKKQNQTYSPGLLSVQQVLPGPRLPFGPFLPKDPEGLENQEALEGPAIPENQEHPTEH